MNFSLLILFLAAFSAPTLAETIDPACASHQGASNLNPFGGKALNILSKCVKLYCGPKVKVENTRDNIKYIDENMSSYHMKVVAYSDSVGAYQKACRALMKNFCQSCPLKDTAMNAVLNVQMKEAEVKESASVFLAQKNFSDFGQIVSRDENDLACGAQIPQEGAKITDLYHSTTNRFANTTCSK